MDNKFRCSNFELLRIIAMFMVLILHADFKALGSPSATDIISAPLTSGIRLLFEMASIVAVNIFVLISGWFGIHPSIRGFCRFAFQCLFFSIGIYLLLLICGQAQFSLRGCADCFALMPSDYWFIPSYIGLYIFSPVLNSFIESVDKRTYLCVLVSFYIFQTLYSFIGGGGGFMMKGYSTISFMGLYLLAGYVRRYLRGNKRSTYLKVYLFITILLSGIYLLFKYMDIGVVVSRVGLYSNPLVVLSSVCLLLYFSKINFHSHFVNVVSRSCFAVYLFHCNPNVFNDYFIVNIQDDFDTYSFSWLFITIVKLFLWFIVPIIIDQVRVLMWSVIVRYKNDPGIR